MKTSGGLDSGYDLALDYADAQDDDAAPYYRNVLTAIAYHHAEDPERWSRRTKFAALELSQTRSGTPPWWAEKMDEMESAVQEDSDVDAAPWLSAVPCSPKPLVSGHRSCPPDFPPCALPAGRSGNSNGKT